MNIFNKNVGHSDLFSWSTLVYNGYSLEWHGGGSCHEDHQQFLFWWKNVKISSEYFLLSGSKQYKGVYQCLSTYFTINVLKVNFSIKEYYYTPTSL